LYKQLEGALLQTVDRNDQKLENKYFPTISINF